MAEYTITASIKRGSSTSTMVFVLKANSQNDAIIKGASKLFSMFSGTDTQIIALGAEVVVDGV